MHWQPQSGTEAITGWINQGVLFALVLAVAAVVVCAATWAVGSLAANGTVVARARTGVAVSLAAALLLGGGVTYVHWTDTQAAAFAGDPNQYGIEDSPRAPAAWEFLDLCGRWTGNINTVRARDGLPPLSTDGGLAERARSCASGRAGQGGDCPRKLLLLPTGHRDDGAWDYGPGDLDKLDQDLAEAFIRSPNPWGGDDTHRTLDPSADMRSAWVALRDNANKKAVVVALLENGAGLAEWNECGTFQ
jgi:hypothetical protein